MKNELKKLQKEVQNIGLTIVPLRLFLTDKGWAKLNIALCRGKKNYDKREVIKDRENKVKSFDSSRMTISGFFQQPVRYL